MHFGSIISVVTDVSFKIYVFIVQLGTNVLENVLSNEQVFRELEKWNFVKYFCLL